MQQINC